MLFHHHLSCGAITHANDVLALLHVKMLATLQFVDGIIAKGYKGVVSCNTLFYQAIGAVVKL